MSHWFRGTGQHLALALSCAKLVSSIAIAGSLHCCFFSYLISWNLYKCPRTFSWASACLRGSSFISTLSVLLWVRFCFWSPAASCLILPDNHAKGTSRVQQQRSTRRSLQWWLWSLTSLVLSIPSILCLAAKSIPGIFRGHKVWLWLMSLSLGAVQGMLGSLVTPFLARRFRFPFHEHVLVPVASLLLNLVFPSIVIVYLDANCLGRWVLFWEPCRVGAPLLQQALVCNEGLVCKLPQVSQYRDPDDIWIIVLNRAEICDPHLAMAKASASRCMELALLRLQDIWLGKFIVSGFLIPPCRATSSTISSGATVGRLVLIVAFAMLSSGYLLLMMPLLLLVALSEIMVAAIYLERNSRMHVARQKIASPNIGLARVLSSIVHLVAVSEQPFAMVMLCGCLIQHAATGV